MALKETKTAVPAIGKITLSGSTARDFVGGIIKKTIMMMVSIFLVVPLSYADISFDIPLDHPVYKNLTRITEKGWVHDISSFRPWTLEQFRALDHKLSHHPQYAKSKDAQAIARLIASYGKDRNARLHADGAVRLLQSNSKASPILQTGANSNGLINDHFQSRQFQGGSYLYFEPRLYTQHKDFFALDIQPSFILQDPINGSEDEITKLRKAYIKFGFHNLEVAIGRIPLAWGQSEISGMLYNGQQKPMDMIRLQNVDPINFPGFLSFLGKGKFSLFISQVDEDQVLGENYIVGERIAISPSKRLELGFSQSIQLGGNGAPDVSKSDYFIEVLGYRKIPEGTNYTNRNFVLDYRVRFPKLNHLNVYGELFFEDCCFPSFVKNIGNMIGLAMPDMGDRFHTRLAFEHIRTTYIYNRHSEYTSGFINRGSTMGNDIGADSIGFYLLADQQISSRFSQSWIAALEVRQVNGYDQRKNDISLIYPDFETREKRYRLLHRGYFQWTQNIRIGSVMGLEKLQHAQFLEDQNPLWYVLRFDVEFQI